MPKCELCEGTGRRTLQEDHSYTVTRCPQCNGTGRQPTETCFNCLGTGKATYWRGKPWQETVPCPTCRGTGKYPLIVK